MSKNIPNITEVLLPFHDYYRRPRQATGGFEKRVESIIQIVKYALQTPVELKSYFSQYYASIYQFREELLKEYPELLKNYLALQNEVETELLASDANKRLVVLCDNLAFAMRTNARIMKIVMQPSFDAPLDIANPYFQEWSYSSIRVEFCLIAWLVLENEDITISDERINDFAFLAADSGQTFGAAARILGLVPKKQRAKLDLPPISDEDLQHQYTMANEDIPSYWQQINP